MILDNLRNQRTVANFSNRTIHKHRNFTNAMFLFQINKSVRWRYHISIRILRNVVHLFYSIGVIFLIGNVLDLNGYIKSFLHKNKLGLMNFQLSFFSFVVA